MALIKITCSRCNGSGKFSFNLTRGTVCFGCEGAGSVMVDSAKHARAVAAKAKRQASADALRSRREETAAQVFAELQADLGPFEDTPKGHYELVMACQREYKKYPGDIVNQRLGVK